jgi:hypothetical protein
MRLCSVASVANGGMNNPKWASAPTTLGFANNAPTKNNQEPQKMTIKEKALAEASATVSMLVKNTNDTTLRLTLNQALEKLRLAQGMMHDGKD